MTDIVIDTFLSLMYVFGMWLTFEIVWSWLERRYFSPRLVQHIVKKFNVSENLAQAAVEARVQSHPTLLHRITRRV